MTEIAQELENDEADIIAGWRKVKVNGEDIEVREFTFAQEMEALAIAQPIINELAELFGESTNADNIQIELVFSRHREAFLQLLAISTGRDAKWLSKIPGRAGHTLYLTFWIMNQHFFVQRVAGRYLMSRPGLGVKPESA